MRRDGSPESGETTTVSYSRLMGPAGQKETSNSERRNNRSTGFRRYTPIDVSEVNGRIESQRE